MTAKSMKMPPTPTTRTITMITVSLSLSLTTHTQTSDKHAACREKKRNSWRKSKKNARSEDVVWSRRRSAGRHKEKEKVCMSGCLFVWDEKEEEDCEKEGIGL